MANEHDALFKSTFSNPDQARAELQVILPAALCSGIAWDTLQLAPGEITDELLDERRADVLLTVEIEHTPVFLYVLFEHKSTVEPLTLFTMAAQVIRIWERWLSQSRARDRLPVILPILVHHSDTGWTSATDLRDLVDVPPALRPHVETWLPSFPVLLDDLSHQSEADIRSRASALLALHLFSLQRARASPSLPLEFGPDWQPVFARAVEEHIGPGPPLISFAAYAVAVGHTTLEELNALFQRMLGFDPRVGAIMDTIEVILQGLHQRFREEHKAEGRAEGKAEGRAEGRADLLLIQLATLFGPLSPDIESRVHSANEAELTAWARRVLTAQSLADVLAGN